MNPSLVIQKTLLGAHSLPANIALVVENLTEVGTFNMFKKMGLVLVGPTLGPTQHASMLNTCSASMFPILSLRRKLLQIFIFFYLFSQGHLATEKVVNLGPQFSKLLCFSRRTVGGGL